MSEKTKSKTVHNGSPHAAHPDGHASSSREEAAASALTRAEKIVDRMGERVNRAFSEAGLRLSRFIARAREEMEDIMAEAESLRRGDPPQ